MSLSRALQIVMLYVQFTLKPYIAYASVLSDKSGGEGESVCSVDFLNIFQNNQKVYLQATSGEKGRDLFLLFLSYDGIHISDEECFSLPI